MSDFMELKLELGTGLKLESAPEPEPAPKPILCKISSSSFFEENILKHLWFIPLYRSRGFFTNYSQWAIAKHSVPLSLVIAIG
jgi:hypothetical protein